MADRFSPDYQEKMEDVSKTTASANQVATEILQQKQKSVKAMEECLQPANEAEQFKESALDSYIDDVILDVKASLEHIVIHVQGINTPLPEQSQEEESQKQQEPSGAKEGVCELVKTEDTGSSQESASKQEQDVKRHDADLPSAEQIGEKPRRRRSFNIFKRRSSKVAPINHEPVKPRRIAFEDEVDTKFICKTEHIDVHGNEVFLINTSKIPKTKNKEILNQLCTDAKLYIDQHLSTDQFGLVIHGGNAGGAELYCVQLARKFYQLLKNSLADKFCYAVIYRADFRLKAIVNLCRPFLQINFQRKFSIASTPRKLVFHEIPHTILLEGD